MLVPSSPTEFRLHPPCRASLGTLNVTLYLAATKTDTRQHKPIDSALPHTRSRVVNVPQHANGPGKYNHKSPSGGSKRCRRNMLLSPLSTTTAGPTPLHTTLQLLVGHPDSFQRSRQQCERQETRGRHDFIPTAARNPSPPSHAPVTWRVPPVVSVPIRSFRAERESSSAPANPS